LRLSLAIKSIRTRMKETMVLFAARIGLNHSTISLYESGKLVPSRSMLIMLFQLAATAEEKSSILDAMGVDANLRTGWEEKELIEAVKGFDIYQRAKKTEADKPRRPWKKGSLIDFAEQATFIVKEIGDVDPCLVDFLRAWIKFHGDPEAVEDFRDVVQFLSIRLAKRKSSGKRKTGSTGA